MTGTMDVDREHFQLVLPEPSWSDLSKDGSHDFRLADIEQVIVAVHVAKKPCTPQELLDVMAMLLKHRLKAAQELSENCCKFDAPVIEEMPSDFSVTITQVPDLSQHLRSDLIEYSRPCRCCKSTQVESLTTG
jgi:hypothetical protein